MDVFKASIEQISAVNGAVRQQYDYGARVQLVGLLSITSAAYLHLFVRRLAASRPAVALLSTLPIIITNIWIPMLFDARTELVTRVVLGLLFFWLGNFKVWSADFVDGWHAQLLLFCTLDSEQNELASFAVGLLAVDTMLLDSCCCVCLWPCCTGCRPLFEQGAHCRKQLELGASVLAVHWPHVPSPR